MSSQDNYGHCIKISSAINDLKKTIKVSGVWTLEGVISGYCYANNLNELIMKKSFASYLKNNNNDIDDKIKNKYVELYDR